MRMALSAAVVLILALPGISQAAIAVSNNNDEGPGSLRQAILDAVPGETISVPAGTYSLTSGELSIGKSLTISGHGAADTIVRAGGPYRVFGIGGAGNDVTIGSITIRDGHGVKGGGGVMNQDATLTLREVTVTENSASADGKFGKPGGIANGGGVYNLSGALHIVDSAVTANKVSAVGGEETFGGIARGGGVSSFGAFTIEGSTIAANTVDARAGQGPSTPFQFGGIGNGGGLFAYVESPSSLSATTIFGNFVDASFGPGGFGGIAQGGGAMFESSAQVNMTTTTIASNEARSLGGSSGIAEGGGLFFVKTDASANTSVFNTTLAGNVVDQARGAGGNVSWSKTSAPQFRSTIVSGGIGPAGSQNCAQKGESQGFNLESSDQCGFNAPGDQVNKDPQLGPLQGNGGPAPTMALASTSPAVDQGSAAGQTTDQRGVLRPIDFPSISNSTAPGADGSDVGAFELQPSNDFVLGELKRNRKKGTATLTVGLPLPDNGTLTLSGKGLRTTSQAVADTGVVKLAVIGKRGVKKALRRRGKRKVQIQVTYSPTGNNAVTKSRTAKLVRRLRKSKHH
jgi:hypothetical protein